MNMFKSMLHRLIDVPGIQSAASQIWPISNRLSEVEKKLEYLQLAIGRIEERLIAKEEHSLEKSEFQVFSQWGEDGILQYLLKHVPVAQKLFIEFGVETFIEANCRWLLERHGWSGLVLDGSETNISSIKNNPVYWKHNLKAVKAFVTAENINQLITESGISGEVGILSVDVDGVDYWIWKAIDCVNPAIVVVEYNGVFGSEASVTIPYDQNFQRSKAHYSNVYYGASLKALYKLGQEKGYQLVGCNQAGNNAFFVRKDLVVPPLESLLPSQAYVRRNFRESRTPHGHLAFMTFEEESLLVGQLPLIEIKE
jgi:hypothetical protein